VVVPRFGGERETRPRFLLSRKLFQHVLYLFQLLLNLNNASELYPLFLRQSGDFGVEVTHFCAERSLALCGLACTRTGTR
jgi:hypothetical protein